MQQNLKVARHNNLKLERRDAYMAALEEASVRQNIVPFANFLGQLVAEALDGKPAAKAPKG